MIEKVKRSNVRRLVRNSLTPPASRRPSLVTNTIIYRYRASQFYHVIQSLPRLWHQPPPTCCGHHYQQCSFFLLHLSRHGTIRRSSRRRRPRRICSRHQGWPNGSQNRLCRNAWHTRRHLSQRRLYPLQSIATKFTLFS